MLLGGISIKNSSSFYLLTKCKHSYFANLLIISLFRLISSPPFSYLFLCRFFLIHTSVSFSVFIFCLCLCLCVRFCLLKFLNSICLSINPCVCNVYIFIQSDISIHICQFVFQNFYESTSWISYLIQLSSQINHFFYILWRLFQHV